MKRAQILERSRRGERHRAQAGEVSVLSGAPYGYRYRRKTDEAPAAYVAEEGEDRVVRRIYEMYTVEGLSIGEIIRRINNQVLEQGHFGNTRHEPSTARNFGRLREWKESTGKGKNPFI